jgi:hypothetical protein
MLALAGLLAQHLHMPAIFTVAGIAWFLFIMSTNAEFAWFRCPRCGKTFAVKWFLNLLPPVLVRRCVHCGLEKYAND